MRTTMLIVFICSAMQTIVFGELTEQDLEAIQKVVKEEISTSEQRTAIKLAEINAEIKVVKTDIQGVKDRLDDTQGLVIAVIALIAVIVGVASAMTYAAGKLGSTIGELRKIYASTDETNELIKQDTAAKNEINRLLSEHTTKTEVFTEDITRLQARIEELQSLIEEARGELNTSPTAEAPAD